MIKNAKQYIFNEVIDPILFDKNISKEIKNKVKATRRWIEKFKKIGDLHLYLKRAIEIDNGEFKIEIQKYNLKSFEDIILKFESKYRNHLNEYTQLNDFIIGVNYTAYDISIYTKNHNIQSGIYLNNENSKIKSIFIKATLEDGDYKNQWLIDNKVIKYYMQGRMYKKKYKKFDEKSKVNDAIINSQNIPIYLFIKLATNTYKFVGDFKFINWAKETNGSKWFKLEKNEKLKVEKIITSEIYNQEFEMEYQRILTLSNKEREKERKNSERSMKAEKITVSVIKYKRNPYIVFDALKRANGICERCSLPAPFYRGSDGSPYLEVHHIIPLSKDGEDRVENVLAICPNCHRELHFGK